LNDRLRNYRQGLFLGYLQMFRRYPWEWFATLSIKDEMNTIKIRTILFNWVRKIQKTERIQVAFVYVICEKGKHQHVHLLMSGNCNANGEIKTLKNIKRRNWEKQWPFFAKIKKVNNQEKACRYLAAHTFKKKCDDYELDFYNLNLLKKIDTQRPS
jgi:hypothetical protein